MCIILSATRVGWIIHVRTSRQVPRCRAISFQAIQQTDEWNSNICVHLKKTSCLQLDICWKKCNIESNFNSRLHQFKQKKLELRFWWGNSVSFVKIHIKHTLWWNHKWISDCMIYSSRSLLTTENVFRFSKARRSLKTVAIMAGIGWCLTVEGIQFSVMVVVVTVLLIYH